MNAVEIEDAVSRLFEQPFEPDEFPYLFLEAYGNKTTTIKRLRTGNNNRSDVAGAVLQHNNIHIAVAEKNKVKEKLDELRASLSTQKQKVKFILATDGDWLEADALVDNSPTVACEYADFPNHFGYFLPLAGITTIRQISENSFDIRATSRLNKLYMELLKINSDWGTSDRRQEMNHFMARLIFCFFAEDTHIFTKLNYMGNHTAGNDAAMFTSTVDRMSKRDGSNVHQVIAQLFKAMDVKIKDREAANISRWAKEFPYVNGSLFSGNIEVPIFNKIARSYLIHIGNLDWKQVNPDIFGSMIQAVTDDEERGALGMHYTSVPNILKVLNPLFLDELRDQLEQAGNSPQKLLNLRKRMAKIRVFDPACGSGNFLVIAYKEMREIESKVNKQRNEPDRQSDIPLTNFRGIEIRHFSAEIARLALIIAEYQCDVTYRGQQEALAEFLPLSQENWIACGNALRINWQEVCLPVSRDSRLIDMPLDQDANDDGGEIYICGNPPYKGNADQDKDQKADIKACLAKDFKNWKSLDYICGWFYLAQKFCQNSTARYAFVSTNSICQGQNISNFWQEMYRIGATINFAVLSFKWSNLAQNNAGVTVAVIGVGQNLKPPFYIYVNEEKRSVSSINAYLVEGKDIWIERRSKNISSLPQMFKGNYYGLSEGLLMDVQQKQVLQENGLSAENIKIFKGSDELIKGKRRYCMWFPEAHSYDKHSNIQIIRDRVESVREKRIDSPDPMAKKMATTPYQFREMRISKKHAVAVPVVSSENRDYLPVSLESSNVVFSNAAFALYDAPLWNLALVASRMHMVWVKTVCGQLETRLRYSNTLG